MRISSRSAVGLRLPALLTASSRLASLADLVSRGASYQRQRAVAAATDGDLVAVVDSVVRELRESLG